MAKINEEDLLRQITDEKAKTVLAKKTLEDWKTKI